MTEEIDLEEFKGYLKIDKEALDNELVEQPMLFYKISQAFVMAAAQRDLLKEKLTETDAVLDTEVREALGDEKYTEAVVKNEVTKDKKHKAAFNDWLRAKTDADLFLALKESFSSRAYMLRDLCALYSANYFENNAIRTQGNQDKAVYNINRAKLANARERKRD